MNTMRSLALGALLVSFGAFNAPTAEQSMPKHYQEVLSVLGKKGDFKDDVLKVNLPRNDLKVTVAGVATPTSFGFGGWLAMTPDEGGHEVMMGDLVLLQEEVNPVMTALLQHGLEVTALHNHFFWEEPRIFYMHVHGHGEAADLARKVKPAIDLIGNVPPRGKAEKEKAEEPARPEATPKVDIGGLDTKRLEQIIGRKADVKDSVVKFVIGRDDLTLKEMGATINARMGLNTWAAFVGTETRAAIAGDVAMLENEVTPVLKALRKHGLDVVAIHHHMTGTQPMIIFLHYWGVGRADELAEGFKAALNELGREHAK